MRQASQPPFALASLLLGLLLVLVGAGGGWGRAYGQTAGPTPTSIATNTSAIQILKRSDVSSAQPGDTVVFTLQLSNLGTTTENVLLSDPIAGVFEVVDVATTRGTARVEDQDVLVKVPGLAPGETVTITIITRVRADASPTQVANMAIGFLSTGDRINSNQVAVAIGELIPSIPNAPSQSSGPPVKLPSTSAAGAAAWPLLVAGLLLSLAGLAGLVRGRAA